MQVRNFLPSYRAIIAIVAAIIIIIAVVILFPVGNKKNQGNGNIKAVKESVKDAGEVFPITISEESKRSLSEWSPEMQATVISEKTKRSLSERPSGFIPATITPEVIQLLILSARSNP